MMNTLSMALKNLRKNFSFYSLYLLSVSLVITVYFTFTSFSVNEVMLKKISEDGRVESMCSLISVFLVIFVIFYMSYSNRFFLRRRTKELGIYALLGYNMSQILSLLTMETVLIGIGSLVLGLVLGALSHKGIVYAVTSLLHLSIDHAGIPFFSPDAVLRTVLFIAVVLIVIALSNARFLYQVTLIELVRFEKSAEAKIKFRKMPAILGLLLILTGYGLSLDIFRGAKSVWFTVGFYPAGLLTALSVACGTVLFIAFFLPLVVRKSKQNKKRFYTETRIVTAPNFIYRIRSNAKTLIMLTLLSAAVLTVSSVMALTIYYPIAAVSRIAPSELEARIEDAHQISEVKQIVSKYAPDASVSFTQTDLLKVTASADQLPMEYSVGSSKGTSENENIARTAGFECISCSQYRSLLQAQEDKKSADQMKELNENECILVKYQPNADGSDEAGSIYTLHASGREIPLSVRETTLRNTISFANSVGTLIVSDAVYAQLGACMEPEASILSINGKAIEKCESLFAEISSLLDGSPYLQGHSHRIHVITEASSSTFLLIGFLVVLFFIAAGSILYFNNVSAVSDSKADYEILNKMGYSDASLKRIVRKQVLTFFGIPFLFGLIDCIFATIIYKTGLMQNLLGNSIALYFPTIIAVAATAFIYFIYYCITVHTCTQILFGTNP